MGMDYLKGTLGELRLTYWLVRLSWGRIMLSQRKDFEKEDYWFRAIKYNSNQVRVIRGI
jgi:hypothetical protein